MVYVLWVYYGKSIYLNHTQRTVKVSDLNHPKVISLSKWNDQVSGQIYGIEIEINGKSDRNLHVLFGPKKNGLMQQVLLKRGTIDFEYVQTWYSDSCYLFFPSEPGSKVDFKISYRFMGEPNGL
jgi:hypothetical protein